MTGLNDARLNGTIGHRPRTPTPTRSASSSTRSGGPSPGALVLALEQPYVSDYAGYEPFHRGSDAVIDAYNATCGRWRRATRSVVVAITGWDVETMVAVDGVHPNDAGHRHLARAVVRTCRQSRWFTDQKAAPRSAASALRSAGRMSR